MIILSNNSTGIGTQTNDIIIGHGINTSSLSNTIQIRSGTQTKLKVPGFIKMDKSTSNFTCGSDLRNADVSLTTVTAFGDACCNDITLGATSTAFGALAMQHCTTGQNTVFGYSGLRNTITGTNNIMVGQFAGVNYTGAESNNIILANSGGTLGESNVMRLGSGQSKWFLSGVRGTTTTNADGITVLVDSAGQLGTVSSSIIYKTDVENLINSNVIYDIRPVSFRYLDQIIDKKHIGLIAEEIESIYPNMAIYQNGKLLTVDYQRLNILLLSEVQKLRKELNEIKQLI